MKRLFLELLIEFKFEKPKRFSKSRECRCKEARDEICSIFNKYAKDKGRKVIIDNTKKPSKFHNFEKILKEEGSGHNIKFLIKWETGEETLESYYNVPEELILSEGFKTLDQRDIPDPPEDESDDEWTVDDEREFDYESEEEPTDESDEESEAEFTDESEGESEGESDAEEDARYQPPVIGFKRNRGNSSRSSKRPRHN